MYTVKQVYEPIVTLKKKNGLCQIMKMDCSTGAIEVYASGLQDEEAMRRIEEDELVMIPQHLFMEEADRVQKVFEPGIAFLALKNEKMKKTKLQQIVPQKEKNMNLNRLLARKEIGLAVMGVVDFFFYIIITYLANVITNLDKIMEAFGAGKNTAAFVSLKQGFWYYGENRKLYFFILFVVCLVFDIYLLYKFKISYSEEYFNVGQKGTARWTTIEEIKKQYKAVPEKEKTYAGDPGTIVAHFDGKMYLDTSINNTLVIGITRSGKGEMYIFPTIDVYSRSENRHSLIVNDPKLENYKASKKTLESRGYDVYLLNLDDPLHSMGYNPLALVIKFFKQGEEATAYAMARTFAYSIFHANDNDNSEPIWMNTATDLFTALIIAVTKDELEMDEALNEMRMQAWQVKKSAYKKLSEERKREVRESLKNMKDTDFIACGSVKELPEDFPFTYVNPHEKQISIYNIIILFSELVRKKDPENPDISELDEYFNRRPMTDLAKLKYATVESASYRTKGSVYTNMLSQLGTFIDENIAKMTAESSCDLEKIGFGDKPIAVFMGTPDYDKSNHFIVSVFIRQLYYILSKRAVNAPNQKCKRPVRFIIDEFGVMPPIEGMDEMVTVGNGKNMGFDLAVQGYSQIFKQYGDIAKTIIDNCANEVFIKSGDEETLEKFSKLLGTETYIDVQRTGSKLSLNRTYMETPSDRPLMRVDQLEQLKEGECVILRKLKRRDLEGKDIGLTPIFNCKKNGTAFLFRYMYLRDTFPDPDTISIRAVNNESREHINLMKRVINVEELMNGIDQQVGMIPEISQFVQSKYFDLIDKKLREEIGEDYLNLLQIRKTSSMATVLAAIEDTGLLKKNTKLAIRSLAG